MNDPAHTTRSGCVYLVGAGPGDPGLITVRGLELLRRADVVIYDYLASPSLVAWAPPDAERIYAGKQAGRHTLSQDEINALLVAKGRENKCVVRLKGGDPYVFGRGGEEALALVEAGVPFEVVPGVSAAVGAAAYAGIPLTHRELASGLGLVTGHETPDKDESDLDWDALAAWRGTLAFYMGVKNLPVICRSLVEHGMDAETPAALIRWGTTIEQQVLVATLAELPSRAEQVAFKPPALIVVGHVVALREKLNFFERRALFGKRVVVTSGRGLAASASHKLARRLVSSSGDVPTDLLAELRSLGAEPIEFPTFHTVSRADSGEMVAAVRALARYDWVVFTSVNGVAALFETLDLLGRDARAFSPVRLCATGSATAAALGAHGLRADLVPERFVADSIVETLAERTPVAGRRFLLPRGHPARKDWPERLRTLGATVDEVIAYETRPATEGAAAIRETLANRDTHWITFTSSSTVENFLAQIDVSLVHQSGVRTASIGPITSETMRKLGLEPTVEAEAHTVAGLLDAIAEVESGGSD